MSLKFAKLHMISFDHLWVKVALSKKACFEVILIQIMKVHLWRPIVQSPSDVYWLSSLIGNKNETGFGVHKTYDHLLIIHWVKLLYLQKACFEVILNQIIKVHLSEDWSYNHHEMFTDYQAWLEKKLWLSWIHKAS
jgi:hypothetical protein